MKQLARVTIIAETADGGVSTLVIPFAEGIQLEEERDRWTSPDRPFARPRIERLILSMRPFASEDTGSVYTQTIIEDRDNWPTPQMIEAFKAEWWTAHHGGDMGNRVRRGLLAALNAL